MILDLVFGNLAGEVVDNDVDDEEDIIDFSGIEVDGCDRREEEDNGEGDMAEDTEDDARFDGALLKDFRTDETSASIEVLEMLLPLATDERSAEELVDWNFSMSLSNFEVDIDEGWVEVSELGLEGKVDIWAGVDEIVNWLKEK